MDIYQISDKFNVSAAKLRKLDKAGLLRTNPENSIATEIRYYLGKGKQLTVKQLVALLDNPALLFDLGNRAHQAEMQLRSLGRCQDEKAPLEIVAEIDQAARGDLNVVAKILPWLKEIIPATGTVGHHYIAVRLVLGSLPGLREYNAARISPALLNCRRHPNFSGWWNVSNGASRYFQPCGGYDL